MTPSNPEPLLVADHLGKVFSTRTGPVRAVDDVSLVLPAGQTVGVVGESGSGKSTLARLLLRLIEPTEGTISFAGVDLLAQKGRRLRELRKRMQMVFQNPYGSLLPHFTAAGNVAEPLRLHGVGDKEQRRAEALRLLDLVGINRQGADVYPRQFSGGQQQRIAIARALALQPDLLVCDEPTSSLDVSIQAQILSLLADLQSELGLTCLFISHNLGVVELLADRVMVMCTGRIVESAPTEMLFADPRHPYTRALLAAVLPVTRDATVSPSLEGSWTWAQGEDTTMDEVAPGHFVRRSTNSAASTEAR